MKGTATSDEEIAVLKELYDRVIRPASRMAGRLNLEQAQVESTLNELHESGLVVPRKGKWQITYDGQVALDSNQKQMVTDQQQTVTGQLKWICWVLAAAVAALGLIDFFWEEKSILNPSRLALVGVVIGLVILPFAQRLKLLGIEFERAGSNHQSETGTPDE
jgi:hypothetical protein